MIQEIFRPSKDSKTAINEIVKRLNELIKAVNSKPVPGAVSQTSGQAGDIKIVEKEDSKTKLMVRTKNGWYETNNLNSVAPPSGKIIGGGDEEIDGGTWQ